MFENNLKTVIIIQDIEYNSESEEEKEKLPAVEKPHVQPQPQPHPLPIAPDSHHTNPHRPTVEELTPIIAPEGMSEYAFMCNLFSAFKFFCDLTN